MTDAAPAAPADAGTPPLANPQGERLSQMVINEEYKIWKKNSPFLYDLVITSALEWPSLTCEWIPGVRDVQGRDVSEHRLILGTHTAPGEMNHLMLANVHLPLPDAEIDARRYDDERGEAGGFGALNGKVEVFIKIPHEGEVNRARHMPQDPMIIATKSPSSEVFVFDATKHPSMPRPGAQPRPEHVCLGHKKEGYGLAWSPFHRGQLLSGSDDGLVCSWDIEKAGPRVDAAFTKELHTDVVEDVAWHQRDPHFFGSCGDDRRVVLWDTRQRQEAKLIADAHSSDVNSLSFNPTSETLFATGGSDRVVKLWDLRNTSASLHDLHAHQKEVFSVQWHAKSEHWLASCGADRRVMVWDLSLIGKEQSAEDAADGPPELLFVHAGHTSKVSDIAWNPNDDYDMMVASVAEDNILHIWQLADTVLDDDEDDEDDEGDEGDGDGADAAAEDA